MSGPCPRHPDEEATLSCGVCGEPLCWRCARSTAVGMRCSFCWGGRTQDDPGPAGEPARGAEALMPGADRRWWLALAAGVLLALASQGTAVPLMLIGAIAISWLERVSARKRLLASGLGLLCVWWASAAALFETTPAGEARQAIAEAPPALAIALCLALAVVACLLFGPSLAAARELRERGRAIAAAAAAVGGLGSAVASLLFAALIVRAL